MQGGYPVQRVCLSIGGVSKHLIWSSSKHQVPTTIASCSPAQDWYHESDRNLHTNSLLATKPLKTKGFLSKNSNKNKESGQRLRGNDKDIKRAWEILNIPIRDFERADFHFRKMAVFIKRKPNGYESF